MHNENLKNNIFIFCERTVALIFGVILCSLLVASSLKTCTIYDNSEIIEYASDNIFCHITVILSLLTLGVCLCYKKDCRLCDVRIPSAFIASVIALYTLFILSTQLDLKSDQKECFTAAQQFLDGNYEAWKAGGYAEKYPNQNGLILFFALIQSIFGKGNHLIMQFINLSAAVVSTVFIAKTSEIILNIKNHRLISLVLLLFAPMILYITFTYGTMIGLALSVSGLYFQLTFFKNKKLICGILSVLLIATAVMFKSNYLIVLVASLLVYMFYAIFRKRMLNILIAVIGVLIYIILGSGVTAFVEGKTQTNLSKGVPTVAWITMGLSECHRGPGWWSGYNGDLYDDSGYDTEKAKEKGIEDLKERLEYMKKEPVYTLKFFCKKILSMWCEPTFQSIWIQQVKTHSIEFSRPVHSFLTSHEALNNIYWQICNYLQTAIYFFGAVYLILNFRKIKMYKLLPAIIMIGGFLFHLVWEAKGQYSVTYFFLIIPYSLCGFDELTHKISVRLASSQQREKAS